MSRREEGCGEWDGGLSTVSQTHSEPLPGLCPLPGTSPLTFSQLWLSPHSAQWWPGQTQNLGTDGRSQKGKLRQGCQERLLPGVAGAMRTPPPNDRGSEPCRRNDRVLGTPEEASDQGCGIGVGWGRLPDEVEMKQRPKGRGGDSQEEGGSEQREQPGKARRMRALAAAVNYLHLDGATQLRKRVMTRRWGGPC